MLAEATCGRSRALLWDPVGVVVDELTTCATGGEASCEPQAASASANMTSPPAAGRRRRLIGSRREP